MTTNFASHKFLSSVLTRRLGYLPFLRCPVLRLQVDAVETRSHYQLHVALPGITKGMSGSLSFSMNLLGGVSARGSTARAHHWLLVSTCHGMLTASAWALQGHVSHTDIRPQSWHK